MRSRKVWLLIGLAMWLVSASGWGTECRFFRVGCLDGEAPENLAITMDESGQTFLEFDTVEGNTYVIEATDSLSPPAWTAVWTLTGDGQRARWLTTRRWSRTFGGTAMDSAYSVEQTSDGGYIVAGWTSSFGTSGLDMYLIKTDQDGKEVWPRTWGGFGTDTVYSVQQTSDGGYIVAGSTASLGSAPYDVYLIKTDADGNEEWGSTFGGSGRDGAYSVQQTSDGGYVVAGYTESFGAGLTDVYLIKTDQKGNELWSRTFGGSSDDCGESVRETSDGGYIVAGWTNSFGTSGRDMYLIKTDQHGKEVWPKTWGGFGTDMAYSVQQTSDGGYVVAGGTASLGSAPYDVYLIKTDADGNEDWSSTFGGSDRDAAYSVQQTSDGGYVVAGYTESFGAGLTDVYLIKTDQNGKAAWSRTFGGSGDDCGESVQQTSDGGYIVAGWTDSFGAGIDDLYLIKTDADGNAPPPE